MVRIIAAILVFLSLPCLANPYPPARKETRAKLVKGVMPIVLDNLFPILVMRDGKCLDQSEQPQTNPSCSTVRFYSLTRYVGKLKQPRKCKYDYLQDRSDWLIGIPGKWNAQPRTLRQEKTTDPRYRDAVRALLASKSVPAKVPVVITRVIRGDLQGDGREEVLIVGMHDPRPAPQTQAGPVSEADLHAYYSFIGLWQVAGKKLSPVWANGDYAIMNPQEGAYCQHDLVGVLDFDADGTMELIVRVNQHLMTSGDYEVCAAYRLTGDHVVDVGYACFGE